MKKIIGRPLAVALAVLLVLGAPALAVDISSSAWTESDSGNNASPPNGWPAGMAPNQVEPAARQMMGALKRYWNRANPVTATTGSAGAYALPFAIGPSSYNTGELFCGRANFTSVGADTLNVSSLGAKPIYKQSGAGLVPLAANDLLSGQMFCGGYDSSLNSGSGGFQLTTSPSTIASPSITGNVVVSNINPPSNSVGGLLLNFNVSPVGVIPTIPHSESIHIVGSDLNFPAIYLDAFQLRSIINGRAARGTAASPSVSLSGDELFRISGRGFEGGSIPYTGSTSAISFFAAENYDPTHNGGWAGIRVQALGTPSDGKAAIPNVSVAFTPSGGALVGTSGFSYTEPNTTNLLTDPGNGFVQATGGFKLTGNTVSDTLSIVPPAFSGSYTFRLPAGSTDFSSTGGAHQVVRQSTTGAALTVGQLSLSDITGQGVSTLWPAADSTSAIEFLKADGATPVVDIDTTNRRLGVGTATPTSMFQVYNNAGAATTDVAGDGNAALVMVEQYNSSSSGPNLNIAKGHGTLASPTAVVSGDSTGFLRFEANDGTANRPLAQLGATVDTINATNDISGYLSFYTRPNGVGAALAEVERLSKTGGESLGTATFNATDPGAGNLAVQGTIAAGGNVSSGGAISASGNISAGGNISAVNATFSGTLTYGSTVLPGTSTGTGSLVLASAPTITSAVLTTPHISTVVNTGTLTLPTTTDTLVGRATTDTLTNKSISGSANTLTAIANASLTNSSVTIAGHTVALGGSAAVAAADLSNGTTGTGAVVLAGNPVLTAPSFSSIVNTGTLTLPTTTDTLVGRATTDTLTNKTISGASNTLTAIPNSALSNSTVSFAGHTVSLGGSSAVAAADLSNGTTGSGSIVLANAPTLINPALGAATATTINKVTITAPTTSATLTFGTDNAVVTFQGTDTYVGRATTDTLTNKTISGASNTFSNIGNGALTNSSVTFAGHTVSLGGSSAIAAADLSNGTTGSGSTVLATSPTFSTSMSMPDGSSWTTGSLGGLVRLFVGTSSGSHGVIESDTASASLASLYAFATVSGSTAVNVAMVSGASGISFTATAGTQTFETFVQSPTTVGSITGNGTNTTYGTSSDRRLKENIRDAGAGLDVLKLVRIRSYDWRKTGRHIRFGVVAQELYSVIPDAVVKGSPDGVKITDRRFSPWQVDYSKLVPVTIKAVQELQAEVTSLRAEVARLRAANDNQQHHANRRRHV